MKYSSWMMKCCSVTNEFTEMQWCETDKTLPIQSFFAHHFAIKLYSIQSIQRFYTMRFFLPKISPILSKVFFFCLIFSEPIFFVWNLDIFNRMSLHFFFHEKKTVAFLLIYLFCIYLFTWNYRCWCNEIENFSMAAFFYSVCQYLSTVCNFIIEKCRIPIGIQHKKPFSLT